MNSAATPWFLTWPAVPWPPPLPVQEGHDRAERAVQPGQAVAQADVGAHGRPVRVAVQVPYPAVRLPPRAHPLCQIHALRSWRSLMPELIHVTTDPWRKHRWSWHTSHTLA